MAASRRYASVRISSAILMLALASRSGFSARSLRMSVARGSANSAAIAGAATSNTAETHSARSILTVHALS